MMKVRVVWLLFCLGINFSNWTVGPLWAHADQSAQTQSLLDFVRSADGKIVTMVQSSEYMKQIGFPMPLGQIGAVEYCAKHGAHLPSARELAMLASRDCSKVKLNETCGAEGISEITSPMPDFSYVKISAKNVDGRLDEFYFSADGYRRLNGLPFDDWTWSSSVIKNFPSSGLIFSFNSDGFDSQYPAAEAAVRCVLGH